MPEPVEQGELRRVMGGFRRMRASELGDEQFCHGCAQFWPLDAEFFAAAGRHLSYVCKACQAERRGVG